MTLPVPASLVGYVPAPAAVNTQSQLLYLQNELAKIQAALGSIVTAIRQLQSVVLPT